MSYSARVIRYAYFEKIHQTQKKEKKKKSDVAFFDKVVNLQHPNLLKWNPTMNVFLGVTEFIFWWLLENIYNMESLQIIDKFCSSPLVIFLNMAYIFIQVIRNGKAFHRLSIFLLPWLAMLCFWLIFIAQYSNILLSSFFTSSCLLFNLHTESKILTFVNRNGRPDILTGKVLNEKSFRRTTNCVVRSWTDH